jgi:hypothetical protein
MRPFPRSARRAAGLIAVAVLFALLLAPAAWATTYTVGPTADSAPGTPCQTFPTNCTLRQLIEHENGLASTPNPADTIDVPAGTYDLNSALTITRSVSIVGVGARKTTVEELASDRVFVVQPPSAASVPTVTISGLAMFFGAATANNGSFGGNVLNQGMLTLSEDWIASGTAQSGGGVSNDGGTLTVTRSLVSGNAANSGGADSGGIQNFGPNPVTGTPGTLEVDNSTIANNTSSLGGGIFSWCGGASGACSNSSATNTTTIVNSTIVNNNGGSRSTTGGGLLVSSGTMSVANTIVAFNTVTGGQSNCGNAGITSLGHNLDSGADCGFASTGDLQNADPQFTSTNPQNNGGNTDTLAPAVVGPAVDAIPAGAHGCAGSDQRDIARPQGSGCDIGAFEAFQPREGSQFTTTLVAADCGVNTGLPITINWGDGTSSSGSPDSTGGAIVGTHVYAEAGTYSGTVSYTPGDCSPRATPFAIKVPDASLAATAAPIVATAGKPFIGAVAGFTDANPDGIISDYSATINWGDGSTSAGTVASVAGGFQVDGTHTYAQAGSYPTAVSVADLHGANAAAHGTATVGSAPTAVITGAPPFVGGTGAAFSGSVNPGGLPTAAFFQYTLDPTYTGGGPLVYTQSTPAQSVGSDLSIHDVSASVIGLVPNALYHVRLVASNSAGTTFGPDVTFTTQKNPPPRSPTIGKTFNIAPVSGLVQIEVNGVFIPLTQVEQIPNGALIDTRHGSLNLTITVPAVPGGARDTAAMASKHRPKLKTQSGTFGGAIFRITQATSGVNRGLATLALVEGAFPGAPTYATCTRHKAGDASAASLSRFTLQLLHASAHGRFRTRGRYSAATVRGTKWTIADRCDGTLTHDITDSVVVNDFVHHKTIVLHAGQSYLAKARK